MNFDCLDETFPTILSWVRNDFCRKTTTRCRSCGSLGLKRRPLPGGISLKKTWSLRLLLFFLGWQVFCFCFLVVRESHHKSRRVLGMGMTLTIQDVGVTKRTSFDWKKTTKDEEGHILLAGGEVYVDQVIFFFCWVLGRKFGGKLGCCVGS